MAEDFNTAADPTRFQEALDWFLQKVNLTKAQVQTLSEEARQRAFWVSGICQADILQMVYDSIQKAIDSQADFASFKKAVTEKLVNEWAGTVKNPGARIETIYRTNMQNAFAAGREAQLTDPDIINLRPYWMHDSLMDSNTSEICQKRNGIIKAASDPYWNENSPPLHYNCRSAKRSLTLAQAKARGITPDGQLPDTPALEGFGARPVMSNWSPDLSGYSPEIQEKVRNKLRR